MQMLWDWIRANLWTSPMLATVLTLLASYFLDKTSWWTPLDGRLKTVCYLGGAALLVFGSYGLALWAGQAVPEISDLVMVVITAVISLIGAPLWHEQRKVAAAQNGQAVNGTALVEPGCGCENCE